MKTNKWMVTLLVSDVQDDIRKPLTREVVTSIGTHWDGRDLSIDDITVTEVVVSETGEDKDLQVKKLVTLMSNYLPKTREGRIKSLKIYNELIDSAEMRKKKVDSE